VPAHGKTAGVAILGAGFLGEKDRASLQLRPAIHCQSRDIDWLFGRLLDDGKVIGRVVMAW
jgi:hypothetical protein